MHTQAGARTIHVALCEAHEFVLEALTAAVQRDPLLRLTASATSVEGLVAARPAVDVLVVDLNVPEWPETTEAVREHHEDVRVLALADGPHPAELRRALRGGADGVLLKTSCSRAILDAIHRLAAGDTILPLSWRELMRDDPQEARPLAELTERQLEVLQLLAAGCSNDEVAARLYISVNTVKFHIRTIYSRLGIRNRADASSALSHAAERERVFA